MIAYSKLAIEYGVKKCVEIEDYQILVAIPISKITEFENFIKQTKYKSPVFYEIEKVDNDIVIRFSNGSVIYTIPTIEQAKGSPVHLAIVDKNVTNNFIFKVIFPLEVLEFKRN